MKFYFGLSKKIKLKWVITILLGLLAYFGIYKNVNADEIPFLDLDSTYQSLDSCNIGFVPTSYTDEMIEDSPFITKTYISDITYDFSTSNLLLKQSSTYGKIEYYYKINDTNITKLYFGAVNSLKTYASTSNKLSSTAFEWCMCNNESCSTCTSVGSYSPTYNTNNNNYNGLRIFFNKELPLTISNNRTNLYKLTIRTSEPGANNNETWWKHFYLSTMPLSSDSNNASGYTNALQTGSLNYCSAVNDSLSLNSNLTDIIIGSINDSLDPLHSAEDSLNNGVSINLDENTSFKIPSLNLSSYTQRLFLLPITILQKVITASESCTPYSINLSSFTNRFGGFNYTLTIPCMRTTISNMIGSTWYNIFDVFLCSFIFFKFAMFLVNQINSFINGDDTIGDIYYAYDETHNHYRDPITHVRYHYNSRTGEVRR